MSARNHDNASDKITASTSSLDHEKHPLPNVTRPVSRDRSVTGDVLPSQGGTSRMAGATAMTGSGGGKPPGAGVDVASAQQSRHKNGSVSADGSMDPVIDDTFDAEPATAPIPPWLAELHRAHEIDSSDLIQRAVAIQAGDAMLRKSLKHVSPQPQTIRNYTKKVAILRELYLSSSIRAFRPVLEALAPYSASKSSWNAMRAALKWHLMARLEYRLGEVRACEAAQKSISPGVLLRLQSTVQALEELLQLDRSDAMDFAQLENRPARSKKDILLDLPPQWRSDFERFNSSSSTYRMAGALLVACGLRPSELEKGVRLRRLADGQIEVHIKGAKVTTLAGQPTRTFRLVPALVPNWFSYHLQNEPTCVVQVDPNALATHLARLSDRVFKPDRDGTTPRLSAYLFRHALVTDLREAGWRSDEIAAVLGETAAETVRWYGLRSGGRRKARPKIAIDRSSLLTARPVRPANKNWPGANQSRPVQTGKGRTP